MLRTRVIFGILMAAGIGGLLLLDLHLQRRYDIAWAPAYFGVIALATVLAVHELALLLRQAGCRIHEPLVMAASLALHGSVLAAQLRGGEAVVWHIGAVALTPALAAMVALVVLALVVETVRGWQHGADSAALGRLGGDLLAFAYIGLLGLSLTALRVMESLNGVYALLVTVAVIKSSDIGGYLFGRAFGRRKLVPQLSPKKTVEGLIGGFLLAMIVSLAAGRWLLGLAWWQLVVFALAVTPMAVLGDLAESLMKRAAGIKDSGSGIPGFGGVLDVLDSILLAAPAAYGILVLFACGR
ncbi:MAG TPA: phosphatidate cytidylyltransferase [Phycisphaerae bacterium]|nr:phosphatidate cytidylyltransferase [Phycisphaerae bacterium]